MKIITRADARALGLTRFYTGKPCKNGYTSERKVCDGKCIACERKHLRILEKSGGSQHKKHNERVHKAVRRLERVGGSQHGNRMVRARRSRRLGSSQYLSNVLRVRFLRALKGRAKVGSVIGDLGCAIDIARSYIEAQFTDDMNWKNHGKVWELDHRIPFCHIDVFDRTQLLAVLHFTNLQPLLIADHRVKSAAENQKGRSNF